MKNYALVLAGGLLACLAWLGQTAGQAAPTDDQPKAKAEAHGEQAAFFKEKVLPLLEQKCFRCHSEEKKRSRGGLVVDSLRGLLKGGETGPALVAGHPEKSLLFQAVEYKNEDLRMPPNGKLEDAELAVLRTWIQKGAHWPGNPPEPAPEVVAISPEQTAFFKEKVLPLLEQKCFRCHSHEAKRSRGGLMVDSLGSLMKGGETGPAVVPGHPEKSLLVQAVEYKNEDLQMPPSSPLKDAEVAVLRTWVKQGAPWPGSKAVAHDEGFTPGKITDRDRQYWAFQPLQPGALPEVNNSRWAGNPIDRHIYARLKKEGLEPAPPADRIALVRRVYFDLIGLPPTPTEIDAFVADKSPDAYENLVDRLLASPRYGEHWARHWLDLVRYAESDGYRADFYRPNVWRYRDYVIRAFNEDKPYDRFLCEQIAGDEMFPDDPEALVATGFLNLWIYEYNQRDVRTQWQDILNDITDVTSEAMLGLGMGCARCHDHKFDPILQKDYYRLQAFFGAIRPDHDAALATPKQRQEYEAKLARWKEKAAPILKEIEAIEGRARSNAENRAVKKFPPDIQKIMNMPLARRDPLEKQLAALAYEQVLYEFERLNYSKEQKAKLAKLNEELKKFDSLKPASLPRGRVVFDVGAEGPSLHLPKKSQGDAIEPGFLTILHKDPAELAEPVRADSTGRRTTLALWLTRPDHPLTSRVFVNRLWQHHFGRGLVNTPNDFGRLGDRPSHPELLDYLAGRFVADRWSIKKMHRLMVTSATYRQSATSPASKLALQKDPQNRLLWRMNTRRLQAEQIRDALLAVTGRLDLEMGGPSVSATSSRRTIYTKAIRNRRDPLLDVFDLPQGITSTGQRNVTTTPTQALLLINGPFMVGQAKSLTARIEKLSDGDPVEFVRQAFRLTFGRYPSDEERSAALEFLEEQRERIAGAKKTKLPQETMKGQAGQAVAIGAKGPRLEVADSDKLPSEDFTVEALVKLHSIYPTGSPRPLAGHCASDAGPGWQLGVTGKKSRFAPQKLVLQLWGKTMAGKDFHEPLFADLHIDLNKPYYIGVAVKLSETGKAGITFYARDLSDSKAKLQSFQIAHQVVQMPGKRGAFSLGNTGGRSPRFWDGLIGEVRISRGVLSADQLLIANLSKTTPKNVAGHWRFEEQSGLTRDISGNGLNISTAAAGTDAGAAARADFCHVLLNANEFLYVD